MKNFILLAMISFNCVVFSCKNGKSGETNELHDYIVKEVSKLPEAKMAEMRIDSTRSATGIPIQMIIEVIDTSLNEKDPANTGTAFISESVEFVRKILYIVKFDKESRRILSVEENVGKERN